jgi:hypothetical protein
MRRRALAAGIVGCLAGALLWGTGPAFAIGASTFEETDGNTVVNGAAPAQDWDGLTTAVMRADTPDTPSGPNDESFTQGTKSDTMVPVIESGSIPPNKSDLTRMRIASETIGGQVYLYVAWNRSNTLGSANMNFEFNSGELGISSNGVTPNRDSGDVLITFDFSNGGNHVDLGLARWAQGACYANGAKAPDCWGSFVDLDAAGFANGSVSGDGRFGEAAINLTAAGVFSAGQCTGLGYAYLSSRSSDSFTAALKDFVPPEEININTCGSFGIVKTADHKGTGSPNLVATFEVRNSNGDLIATVETDATGHRCVNDLPPGTYTVDEVAAGAGYALDPSVENVVVAVGSTCASNTVSFHNVPLSKITVTFESLVPNATAADISCTSTSGPMAPDTADGTPGAFDDTAEAYGNLTPGTYTCVVVVDP